MRYHCSEMFLLPYVFGVLEAPVHTQLQLFKDKEDGRRDQRGKCTHVDDQDVKGGKQWWSKEQKTPFPYDSKRV